MTFVEQYQRYYCHHCLQYAPEGYGDRGAKQCPTCGGILSYVRQYGRMYCYHCQTYPPEEPTGPPKAAPPAAESSSIPTSTPATAEATTASGPSELAPAPVVIPAVLLPSQEPSSEPKKEGAPKPVEGTPPATPESASRPVEPVAAEKAPEAPEAPPSREIQALAAQKPAAVRVKLFALKKSELVDLCRIYGLDSSGTKEQMQERLLGHLHDVESEGPGEEGRPAGGLTARGAGVAAAVTTEPSAQEPPKARAVTVTQPETTVAAPKAAQERQETPAAVAVTTAPEAPEAPRPAPRVEHPCPTCGRELTYISQYGRHYCYYCQRYAPAAARAKNACPTCGATMRWIDQHRRWWCDSCRRYASADLPAPAWAAPVAVAVPIVRTVAGHRHGSPAGGAGLVGLGVALYIVYAFFGFLGGLLGFVRPAGITQEMLDVLQFFAFILVAIGAIVGLYGLRHRE